MYLAENLQYLRTLKKINQTDLAEYLNTTCGAVSMWERGKRVPDIETIVKIAAFFMVSLDELILKSLRPPIPMYAINLRYLRTKYGMTQEQIGELVGLKNKSSLSLIEMGKCGISVESLEKLADYFGVTLDQLVKQDLSKEGQYGNFSEGSGGCRTEHKDIHHS
ncbi:MAG: helix-turn-helix domain-containing protein [Clostridium sp.]|nr:helix-turn-helix domain-containing protein [Clostridium sp.]